MTRGRIVLSIVVGVAAVLAAIGLLRRTDSEEEPSDVRSTTAPLEVPSVALQPRTLDRGTGPRSKDVLEVDEAEAAAAAVDAAGAVVEGEVVGAPAGRAVLGTIVVRAAGKTLRGEVGEQGRFRIEGVPPGEASVTFEGSDADPTAGGGLVRA